VFCGDCREGIEAEIEQLRAQVRRYGEALARYDGGETGWQAQYRASLEGVRGSYEDRIVALTDRLRRVQGDELAAAGAVRALGMREYVVDVAGDLDVRYLVDLAEASCGCDAWREGTICEHVYAALSYERALFVAQALAHREGVDFSELIADLAAIDATSQTRATALHVQAVALVAQSLV